MSHQLVGKTNIFLDTLKQEIKKRRTCFFFQKKEWKRKPKRRVTKKKTRNYFSRHKRKPKHGQTKCRKVPNKKKKQTKLFLRWSKKTEKERFAEVYKDTQQKHCEKVFDWENKETTKDKEKRIFKRAARRKQRENTERQKREQVDLGRTTGKIKRQRRHSKKEKVEKVFWCGNSEEIKKKEMSEWASTNCQRKQSLFC